MSNAVTIKLRSKRNKFHLPEPRKAHLGDFSAARSDGDDAGLRGVQQEDRGVAAAGRVCCARSASHSDLSSVQRQLPRTA